MPDRALVFDPEAWDDYLWWQRQDRKTLAKINALIREACRTPTEGTGKVEDLGGGRWSRRINSKDRLVYSFTVEHLLTQCKGHYDDN